MVDRDIGLEILEGIQEIKAYKSGKIDLKTRELKTPSWAKQPFVEESGRDFAQRVLDKKYVSTSPSTSSGYVTAVKTTPKQ